MTEQGDAVGWLPGRAEELFGPGATASEAYDVLTVDVPAAAWTTALHTARDELGCTFFDWLSAVDEPAEGFRIAAHVVALGTPPRRLLLRTTVPHGAPALATATGVYAGAAWHERETHEMFGVDFAGHPHLARLLLPEEFEGHPLRKDFVLAARVAKAWPGAKEPGESHAGGPKRRQMQPPGVPDPNDWGPQKGTLPPAPTRTPRRAGAPSRRTRSAGTDSATQSPPADNAAEPATPADPPPAAEAGPGRRTGGARRTRTAGEGSASQRAAGGGPEGSVDSAGEAAGGRAVRGARRARSAGEGSASQRAAGGGPAAADQQPRPRIRTPDAPWQRPRPDDEPPPPAGAAAEEGTPPAGAPAATEPPASGGPGSPPEPAAGDSATPRPAAGEPASTGESPSGDPSPAGSPDDEPGPSPGPAAGEPDPSDRPAAGDATPPAEPAAGEPAGEPADGGDVP